MVEHCEWDQVRRDMADEEQTGMQFATCLILLVCFGLGFGLGTAFYAVLW